MGFRVASRKLARPVARAGAAASTSSSSSSTPAPAPLLQFPAFHPIPFRHDKFLSIKARSLEMYTKLRGDVLQRCAELRTQLQRNQERAERSGGERAGQSATTIAVDREPAVLSSPAFAGSVASSSLPLTPHQAEELLLLSKKVESLTDYQGMVLPDELVWRMFHLCIQCGAPQQAIDNWLRKHILAEQRGPPYPLFIVEDLATLLRAFVLPRLPESGASLSCSSSRLLSGEAGERGGLVGLESGLVAAQRYLQVLSMQDDTDAAVVDGDHSQSGELYATHLAHNYVWPVWRSLEAMKLTLDALKDKEDVDGDGEDMASENERGGREMEGHAAHGEERGGCHNSREEASSCWCPGTMEQTKAVRAALMSVTPLYSFHQKPLSSSASPSAPTRAGGKGGAAVNAKPMSSRIHTLLALEPPSFASQVDAVVAPLRALLDVWLAVAQCASEVKDIQLLHEVQRTICVGFLCCSASGAPHADDAGRGTVLEPSLNEAAWCRYPFNSSADSASRPTDEEVACRNAAEAQAREIVQNFVGDALSVVQYGLLCAEQEQALWQLHDTGALVIGGASMLRRWLKPDLSRNSAADAANMDNDARRLRALYVIQNQTEDAEHNLLCHTLPRALRGMVHKKSANSTDAAMLKSVHAFLSQTLAPASAANIEEAVPHTVNSTALSFADAGVYVGLAMGDEALLQQAAEAASMPESGTAVVRLVFHSLLRYRRAVLLLVNTDGDGKVDDEEAGLAMHDKSGDVWERVQSLKEWKSAKDDATSAAQILDGCLQAILLDAARVQVECATAYVRAVHTNCGAPDAITSDTEADLEGSGERRTFHSIDTEEARLEAAKQALTHMHKRSTQSIAETLANAATLLSRNGCCLSPSALSSLALLCRLGIYLEQANSSTEDTSSSAPFSSIGSSLDIVASRLTTDTCSVLQHTLSSPPSSSTADVTGPTTAVAGTWVQWVLVTLMSRRDWTGVLAVLKALDGLVEGRSEMETNGNASLSLLCSATVDPAVFAALYARAQEDGAAGVCAFLRPRRETLFF
ncbi:hypothetical protein ABL78_6799 [Leptomonas seymouri]|uniref:Uncharacterized protein n=1 Tax=Leptomonas seymouri TaxID=5684 RepID=A0A0N1IHV3_LEPSE|nr:hypothetical protein ABL78_6799 [Leptomonas seymouri]|eukprot:KPI84153.1 hypothetical protein ABL78_6799 [Leptomonas seymouri]